MIFDDNILKFMDCGKTLETDLPDLIRLGFSEMHGAKAKIWSGSDSPNPAHWSADVDIGMGLVCLNLLSTGTCLMGMQVLDGLGSLRFSPVFVPHDGPIEFLLSEVVFGHPHFFPVSLLLPRFWFVSQVRGMLWYGCNSRRVSVFTLWPSNGWHRAILSFLWTRWCHCALGQIASIQEARSFEINGNCSQSS